MTREQARHILIGPIAIWAALLVLLLATGLYAYLPGAPAKFAASLSIGAAKAILVALFFMRLTSATGLVRMAAIIGLAWTSFLYLFSLADLLTR